MSAYLDGIPTKTLALIVGVTVQTIRRWIRRGKTNAKGKDWPKLDILMSPAGTTCQHGILLVRLGPDAQEQPWLCLDCDRTGMPSHPAFHKGHKEETKPPPKSTLSEGEENKVVWELPAK